MTDPVWQYLGGICSLGGDLGITHTALGGGAGPASAVFPASNDAIFVPVYLKQTMLIQRLFSINGATASGNIDVGIYAEDGAKITSAGSTAQSGTNVPQFFNITDVAIGPGRYYLAVAMDNGTGTLFRVNTTVARCQTLGMAKMATAFALPASATFATCTAGFIPLIGAEVYRVL